jgi:hypothetical protein
VLAPEELPLDMPEATMPLVAVPDEPELLPLLEPVPAPELDPVMAPEPPLGELQPVKARPTIRAAALYVANCRMSSLL